MAQLNWYQIITIICFWSYFIGMLVYIGFDLFVRVKAVNNPKYKAYLEEERLYNKERKQQELDFNSNRILLKQIHAEKMDEIRHNFKESPEQKAE